jgi:predicted DNA-binding protein with PD1-like motif
MDENRMICIELKHCENMLSELEKRAKDHGVEEAAIVSMIGALDSCVISNMDKKDALKDLLEEYSIPLEVTGSGYISKSKAHVHVIASSNNGETYAGHLHSAIVDTWFVRVYLMPV